LKEQESDILAAMRRKVEEKRKDLHDAETVLEQLQGKLDRSEAPRDVELPSPRTGSQKQISGP
jgi:hypothetical protein